MKRIVPPYSMKVIPQTREQFIHWAKVIRDMRQAQMGWGSGSLLELDFPNLEIMMPKLQKTREVIRYGKK